MKIGDRIYVRGYVDEIRKDAVIVRNDGGYFGTIPSEVMGELPSAQPEIIACGDCKHWICHDKRCGYWNHGVKPLDWCSRAERRTDDQT